MALAHVLDGAIAGDGGHGGVADAPGRGGGGELTFTWKACPASRVKSVRLRDRAPEAPEPLPLEEDAPEVTEL